MKLKMNSVLVLCLILAVTMASLPLSDVLKSPTKTLKLYRDYKAQQHVHFSAKEDRLRFGLWKLNAAMVAHLNEDDPNETAEFELNFFSYMTAVEKKSYLGLNVTGHLANAAVEEPLLEFVAAPASKLWTNEGAVTPPKNQGGCGSCWAFAAVGGLETRYKHLSGRLRNFADQEWLDCTYGPTTNGCGGGWPNSCYNHAKSVGGRLAATADYPYVTKDGPCLESSKPNAAIAYKIDGYTHVGGSESNNIAALATGSLSMAFQVTSKFSHYSRGILKDTTCTGGINHGVTGVGYTPTYVLVKNSWGTWWGDQGYVKLARNHHNCQIFNYSSYALLTATGTPDDGPDDTASDYVAPDPTCDDQYLGCEQYYCQWASIAGNYCQSTCAKC